MKKLLLAGVAALFLATGAAHAQELMNLEAPKHRHRRARRQLQRKPLCAMCLAEGKVIAARIADHIEPHHNDPVKFWAGALQSLGSNSGNEPGILSWFLFLYNHCNKSLPTFLAKSP